MVKVTRSTILVPMESPHNKECTHEIPTSSGEEATLTKKNYTKIYVTYTWNILHIYVSYMYSLCRYMLGQKKKYVCFL